VPHQAPEEAKEGKGEKVEKLRLLLGLSPDAEDQVLWAGVLELCRNLAASLKLPAEAAAAQILEAVEALQLKAQRLAEAEEELRQLKSRLAGETTDRAVEEALKAGKITPAQKTWALEYYRQDPGGFQTFVARAPQVVPIGKELQLWREDGQATGHLVPEELVLCRSLNLSPEQYLQAKARIDRAH
jgi:phage I-like protein